MRLATRVIHAGQSPDPTTGAVMSPVYLTSTYRQPGFGEEWPWGYARGVNPTRHALERMLADLEGGADARAFASGMAAIEAVLHGLTAGDHVIATDRVYGGTRRLFDGVLERRGTSVTWTDTTSADAVEAAIRPSTRMLYLETPTNPTLVLTDLRVMARIAGKHDLTVVVDNTFMTPCLQRPLELGAHIVVHSTTKYLNGHSDSIGGAVVTTRAADAESVRWYQNSAGGILAPMDCFLVLRGLKTLDLRMQRHEANARRVARHLERHSGVREVFYPGLRSHPQHALAKRQMGGFGGIVTFDVGTLAKARRLGKRLRIATPAESLGGVETLVSHPATMSHGSLSTAERRRQGIGGGLIRLSVGIEAVEDLIDDLDHALG
ncbi:PLP-dependent aspartate aminotransferase family protein [bacterium]|nr:PLP-dependent aspartate aminotransferase family protein [bacterium]